MSSGAASDVGVRPSSNNNFVTRTYIGGGGNPSSSLAIKIHKRSLSRLASNPGSLTSLHETSLNSDVEDVRSSCSAYRPVTRSFGETRSCVGGIRDGSSSNFSECSPFQIHWVPLMSSSDIRSFLFYGQFLPVPTVEHISGTQCTMPPSTQQ